MRFQELYKSYAPEICRFAYWLAGKRYRREAIDGIGPGLYTLIEGVVP